MILKNASRLKGTSFGISRDFPSEISDARKELWPEFKRARAKYGPRGVSIRYPAALIINGDTVKDLFPDWFTVLKGSRNSDVRSRVEEQVKVLASEVVRASKTFHAPIESDSDDDQDSDMETQTSTPINTPHTATVHTTSTQLPMSDKQKRPAPAIPSTPPVNAMPWTSPLNLTKTLDAPSTTDHGGSQPSGDQIQSPVTAV